MESAGTFRVVDLETTGLTEQAEVIEVGWVDVIAAHSGWAAGRPCARLFRPRLPLNAENIAVHHITDRHFVSGVEPINQSDLQRCLLADGRASVLVAHNAGFERQFISDEVSQSLPWVCTYRAARKAWPSAPRHSNQVLRYWLGLDLDPALAMPPHRAGPDAYVTAHILIRLLDCASLETLIEWSQ